MIVKVTKQHILCGEQEDTAFCPVALALKDIGAKFPEVDYGRMKDTETGVSFHCPRSVQRFVKRFDKKGKKAVKPFSFKLKIIS